MERGNKMAVMPMKRLVADMSIPMMLSLLIQSLYNIVDSIFVARLGENALAAASLAYPVQMLMIAVGVGTAVGLNAVLSKALGAGKYDEASKIAASGVALAVLSSLAFVAAGLLFSGTIANAFTENKEIAEMCHQYLFICMTYSTGNLVCMTYQRLMQAAGKSFLSMVILAVGAITNIVLDPIMIFGLLGCPAFGIRGAAAATVLGQWVSMVTGLILQKYCNKDVNVSFKGFRFDTKIVKGIYKVGFPTMITQAMQSMMVTCFNVILQPFSTTAVAFFGVYYKLQTFLFMPMNGLGQAGIPIVGFNFGAGNKKRIYEAIRVIYPAAMIISLIGSILFMSIPAQLLGLFAAGDAMLKLGVPALRIIAPTFILGAVTLISGYIASGLQDGMTNMAGAVIRQFVPLIPCAYLLGKVFGIGGVWYGFWISEICGVLYSVFRVRKLLKIRLSHE
ncbi:MAG TPA: MATE family efflux transporter [Lachnospiraceae bacterium]|nr:MATE family efflux transporter [Lachnospiraceae bacterium]